MAIPSLTDANGIWTLNEVRNAVYNGTWPVLVTIPTAPTLTNIVPSSGAIAAIFTAPVSTGGRPITSYTATATPGNFTGTSATSPVTVSGLTNGITYTISVVANNAVGSSASSNTLSVAAGDVANGQAAYTTAGTYSWVAPAAVTQVSAVAVGGGSGEQQNQFSSPGAPGYNSGGSGGGLGWKNSIVTVPGASYTVVVGIAGPASNSEGPPTRANAGSSYFISAATVQGNGATYASGGSYTGDGGGTGGNGTYSQASNGAGGAGGYSGAGGNGGLIGTPTGAAGNGGAGSGGGFNKGSGGGVGILGEGASGASVATGVNGNPGSGGSGLTYGGGAGNASFGGVGAVRIIWGNTGGTRAFPSTRTGNL